VSQAANKGVFVIGTDTNVGKTVVSAGLALCLKKRQVKVGVMKPVATGCMASDRKLYSQDAIYLFEAAENEYPLLSSPMRFRNPLAPQVASEIEGEPVDLKKIMWAYREIRSIYDFIIVEGIGGLMVPFTNNYFVADLVKEFDLPVVIVARATLGTINHTLLTVQAAKAKGLDVVGIILNGMPRSNLSVAEMTNPRIIGDLTGLPVLGVVPELPGVDVDNMLFDGLREAFEEHVDIDIFLREQDKT